MKSVILHSSKAILWPSHTAAFWRCHPEHFPGPCVFCSLFCSVWEVCLTWDFTEILPLFFIETNVASTSCRHLCFNFIELIIVARVQTGKQSDTGLKVMEIQKPQSCSASLRSSSMYKDVRRKEAPPKTPTKTQMMKLYCMLRKLHWDEQSFLVWIALEIWGVSKADISLG